MTKLRDLIAIIRDMASQGKAVLLSKPLALALLRATACHSLTPPSPKHLSTLLSFDHASRATASAAVGLLMDRLHVTHNSVVALKCLVVIHHVTKHGSFILQDQLSVYPSAGGRNYLKLSGFRDNSTPMSWELSSWVRWYAQYIEQLLSTSRVLGIFLGSSAQKAESDQEERVSGVVNSDLLRETDSLVTLVEEMGKIPDTATITNGKELVGVVVSLVSDDWVSAVSELWVRVRELRERVGCLSFEEAIELTWALKKLEECKERMVMVTKVEENFWSLVREVKEKAGMESNKEDGKLLKTVKRQRATESHRFAGTVLNSANLVPFSIGGIL